jgi:hypothetical protein
VRPACTSARILDEIEGYVVKLAVKLSYLKGNELRITLSANSIGLALDASSFLPVIVTHGNEAPATGTGTLVKLPERGQNVGVRKEVRYCIVAGDD